MEERVKSRLSLFDLLPSMGQCPGPKWAMTLASSTALGIHIPKVHQAAFKQMFSSVYPTSAVIFGPVLQKGCVTTDVVPRVL